MAGLSLESLMSDPELDWAVSSRGSRAKYMQADGERVGEGEGTPQVDGGGVQFRSYQIGMNRRLEDTAHRDLYGPYQVDGS